MSFAEIRVFRHRLATGQEYLTFAWDGPHDGIVRIGAHNTILARNLHRLPWKLKEVKYVVYRGTVYYIREDSGLDGWIIEQRYRLQRFEQWFRERFVATLAVWGLARWAENTESRWSDIGIQRKRLRGR
jgi:hypothetical protein